MREWCLVRFPTSALSFNLWCWKWCRVILIWVLMHTSPCWRNLQRLGICRPTLFSTSLSLVFSLSIFSLFTKFNYFWKTQFLAWWENNVHRLGHSFQFQGNPFAVESFLQTATDTFNFHVSTNRFLGVSWQITFLFPGNVSIPHLMPSNENDQCFWKRSQEKSQWFLSIFLLAKIRGGIRNKTEAGHACNRFPVVWEWTFIKQEIHSYIALLA